MRGVLLLFTLILSNVINSGKSKKKSKPEKTKDTDISQLPLDPVDADDVASLSLKNVDTLGCGQKFDFSSGASVAIQTKNYPRNYPGSSWWNGYAGNCDWHFSVPALAELRMLCDSFDVKKGESFYFPLNVSPSDKRNYVKMSFRSNWWRNGRGFRCTLSSSLATTTPPQTTTTTTTATTTAAPTTTTAIISNSTTTVAPTTTTTAATSTCNCGIAQRQTRIVGGVETEVNEYPWQVGLVSRTGIRPWCGGSLLSARHVLTAAHCTVGQSAASIRVLVGEHDTTDSVADIRAISAITDHPSYNN